ncbi:MAG: transposase [Bacteroidetes bacterium]|nr:MAG: transposase [Bacteroidota bacterium]
MEKYKNKYRIPSARAQWWDYGWNGAYFVTICTRNRVHYFGEIRGGKMVLSPTGVIADILWHEIPHHSPFVQLGDFVVMPNHVHGILVLNKPQGGDGNAGTGETRAGADGTDGTGTNGTDGADGVETGHALSLHPPRIAAPTDRPSSNPVADPADDRTIGQKRFQQIGKNTVSSIVGSYKSAVTKHANRLGLENGRQPRFHDHIIRSHAEYQRISDYIIRNPVKWQEDKFYSA